MFLLPHALKERAETLAVGFIDSLTMGVGQLCTNPGLVLGLRGPALDRFRHSAAVALAERNGATMLSAGIHDAYTRGIDKLAQQPNVVKLASGVTVTGGCKATPGLFTTNAESFLANAALSHEVFGPSSLLVVCEDFDEMLACARHIEGQLTCTLHLEPADFDLAHRLLPVLEEKAGRILANGFPTGVEVASAMVHGGPFPATSDGRSTSVGTAAIERFLRPVCYQNLPQELLPPTLRDGNPERIPHRRNGELVK
jgi:2,5-dioxopentanoate dehydrogenase